MIHVVPIIIESHSHIGVTFAVSTAYGNAWCAIPAYCQDTYQIDLCGYQYPTHQVSSLDAVQLMKATKCIVTCTLVNASLALYFWVILFDELHSSAGTLFSAGALF